MRMRRVERNQQDADVHEHVEDDGKPTHDGESNQTPGLCTSSVYTQRIPCLPFGQAVQCFRERSAPTRLMSIGSSGLI
jgi:hypothetical protein